LICLEDLGIICDMSQFKDLEQQLQGAEAARQQTEEERLKKLLEARDRHLPALQRAYAVFGDFYATLLAPRGYRAFPRRKDGPTLNEQRYVYGSTAFYAYVANVVSPSSQRPYPNDEDRLAHALNPVIGEDHHIWHPNIALHFASTLTPNPKSQGEVMDLSVEVRAWGRVEVNPSDLAEQGMVISYSDAGWNRHATFITLQPEEEKIEQQVGTALRIVIPNVINHKEAFRR
jgi:hypothetical protein